MFKKNRYTIIEKKRFKLKMVYARNIFSLTNFFFDCQCKTQTADYESIQKQATNYRPVVKIYMQTI